MRKRKFILSGLFLTIWLLAAGCGQAVPAEPGLPAPALTAFPEEAEVFEIQPTFTPVAEADKPEEVQEISCSALYFLSDIQRPNYQMDVYAGLEQHALSVHEVITYPNMSGDWLENIRLVVDPNWTPGVFNLTDLLVSGEVSQEAVLEGGYLDIPLSEPLPPGCMLVLNIKYILTLPNQEGIFGYTDDHVMLTNWYPFIPPYNPDWGWQTNPPGEYGEHFVYPLADFQVRLEFQEKGLQIPVAAPAAAEQDGEITTYSLTGARTFSMAFLPRHSQLSQTVDDTVVNVYYRKSGKRTAQAALDTMTKSIQTFEALFGDYPFESLTTAEIEMYDGMEYDGIFFVGEGVWGTYNRSQQNIFSLLLAHETSHNWWFSQVGNDQAIEPWLDEALATYSELLYLEANYPELVNWWWNFRVEFYEPSGPVDVTIYEYANYEDYRQAVYLRGVLFLQAVREQVGDEAFFEFLRQYYLNGQYQIASEELFFETLEQVTMIDSDLIRNQFFVH